MSLALGIFLVLVLLAVSALIQLGLIGRIFFLPIIIAGVLSILTVLLTSRVMPRKTQKGRIAWEKILGLQEYIRRAEVDDSRSGNGRESSSACSPSQSSSGCRSDGVRRLPISTASPRLVSAGPADGFLDLGADQRLDRSIYMMNQTFPSQPRVDTGSGTGRRI